MSPVRDGIFKHDEKGFPGPMNLKDMSCLTALREINHATFSIDMSSLAGLWYITLLLFTDMSSLTGLVYHVVKLFYRYVVPTGTLVYHAVNFLPIYRP